MPLTKQYLKYVSGSCLGVVCSRKTGSLLLEKRYGNDRKWFSVSPALENVIIWDLKSGEKVWFFVGENHEVTSLAKARGGDANILAVGYEDGTIRIWNLESHECQVTFSGHKSAVTYLHFDVYSTRLVSGSKDTDVIIWDIVSETGLFRLKGHKGPITWCQFLTNQNVLITCSTDTLIKLWDLDTQHCFQTLVGHRSEVWGAGLLKEESWLVTASSDKEMRIFEIYPSKENDADTTSRSLSVHEVPKGTDTGPVNCRLLGTIQRQFSNRVLCVQVDQTGKTFAVMSGESVIEMYHVREEGELEAVKKKLIKRAKKKAKKIGSDWAESEVELTISDEISLLRCFHSKHKMKSCDISYRPGTTTDESGDIMLLLSLCNNSLELHTLSSSSLSFSITQPGHRSDIRTVCFNTDGSLIASGSADQVKIWKTSSGQCLHTLQSGYALSTCFLPGDRYILIGIKTGEVLLYELSQGSILETFEAHSKAVWSVGVAPDRQGFVTGSADHDVKFWEFELISDDDSPGRKRLSATHIKTLKMSEDVLCVKYSPDQRLLAVALLDSTVKIFFADTLKFFLSLYGHKLPVLTMDISSDSSLLVTGSADKNIKIWGLDYGDCHRSIFAHDDSIMGIQFVPATHLVFSVSKDKTMKCWDVDKFEHVQTLQGHQAEIWSLAISNDGNTVVTGSHDLSLRTWECTQEPLVLSEERENERELEFEKAVAEGGEPVIPGERNISEAAMAGKKSIDTMKAAERVMEALQIYRDEEIKMADHREECQAIGKEIPPPLPHPILKALGSPSPEKYLLSVMKNVRSSELDKSLLVLPFSYVIDLMKVCDIWLQKGWEVELSCRCLFFLLRVHHHQITSSHVLLPIIDSLRHHTISRVDSLRDLYGFNLAGMHHLEEELKSRGTSVFKDVSEQVETIRKRKRKKTK